METVQGKITFIHHEKQYATIEYIQNGKTKTINGNISEKEQLRLKELKIIQKVHHYNIGDEVSFVVALSARGDKQIADCMQFLFNNELDNIINKANIENRLVGYLKKVDDDYFVKETSSYILFPLILSPWEIKPQTIKVNEPVFFKLDNLKKTGKHTASMFRSEYIPEYLSAMNHFRKKTIITATVYNVSPHGVYVDVIGNKIQAKLPADESASDIKIGDKIPVLITYLSGLKIIIEKAGS
jgi:ribosomal protein S1